MWAVLPKRFARYGLTLHPEKTRLIAFRRPTRVDRDATARPTSFDMLGFTRLWSRSERGYWVIKRKTARDRLSRALRVIAQRCRQHRHVPGAIDDQHEVSGCANGTLARRRTCQFGCRQAPNRVLGRSFKRAGSRASASGFLRLANVLPDARPGVNDAARAYRPSPNPDTALQAVARGASSVLPSWEGRDGNPNA